MHCSVSAVCAASVLFSFVMWGVAYRLTTLRFVCADEAVDLFVFTDLVIVSRPTSTTWQSNRDIAISHHHV